ncbi:MAG: prepilin-type N-terminal cleavage/methylation domain-containing protein [Thermoanaerobaculia bacterium]
MTERPREAGFSLIELLVSMLVLLIVLMVTNGLLVESLRIFSNSGRELREPGTELALRLLREDLHAAAPLPGGIGSPLSPVHFALDCRRPGRTESWEMDGSRLVRRTYDPDGVLLGTRPMLDKMVTFEWWTPAPGLVQIRLTRRRPAGASALRVATAAWKSAGDELEAAQVVAGSRLEGSLSP